MIKIKPKAAVKRDSYVVMNGIGTIMYSTDNPVDMQEWYNQNYQSPLAWSYSYAFYDKDGYYHEVEIDES